MFFSLRQSVLLIPNMLFMILISVPALAWESDDGGFWENSQDDFEYDRNNSFGENNTPSNQAKYSVDDLLRKLDEIEKNIQFEQIKISLLESQIAKTLNNVETKLPDYATDIDQLKRENETLQNHLDELALKYNQQIATMQAEKQSSNGIAVVDDKDKNDNAYYHDLINDQPTDNWSSEIPEKRILLPESNSISTKNGTMHTTEQEDAYSQSSHHLMVALGFIMPWLPSADAYVTHGLRTRHFYSVAPAFQLRIGYRSTYYSLFIEQHFGTTYAKGENFETVFQGAKGFGFYNSDKSSYFASYFNGNAIIPISDNIRLPLTIGLGVIYGKFITVPIPTKTNDLHSMFSMKFGASFEYLWQIEKCALLLDIGIAYAFGILAYKKDVNRTKTFNYVVPELSVGFLY